MATLRSRRSLTSTAIVFTPVEKLSSVRELHSPRCELASAGAAAAGKDVDPLHHANILMGYNVTMHDKAPNALRVKMNPKGDRPDRVIVDIWLWAFRCRGVRYGAGHNNSVMPFGL
jgi:hypothetical protein